MTNQLTVDQLIKQVEQWSKDKDLHNGNPDRQALKFYEEAGEVGAALSRSNLEALKDGIGDTVVTFNGTFIKESDLKE